MTGDSPNKHSPISKVAPEEELEGFVTQWRTQMCDPKPPCFRGTLGKRQRRVNQLYLCLRLLMADKDQELLLGRAVFPTSRPKSRPSFLVLFILFIHSLAQYTSSNGKGKEVQCRELL